MSGEEMMKSRVGIVIASQSLEVAKGTASLVWDLVGNDGPCAYVHVDQVSNDVREIEKIQHAIQDVYSTAGVVVLVDVGSVECLVEEAICRLQPRRRTHILVCDAPIVEGAVMAATFAKQGACLNDVRLAAESLNAKGPHLVNYTNSPGN